MDADRTKMDGDGRMDGKMDGKRARLVMRGGNIFRSPYEIWDVGCGCSICVAYRVLATGEPVTVAFPFDMVEKISGPGVLGSWLGDATGGKAIRELGYEIEGD